VIRWAVSGIVLLTLAALVAGWRMRTAPRPGAAGRGGRDRRRGRGHGPDRAGGDLVQPWRRRAGGGDTRQHAGVPDAVLGTACLPHLWLQGLLRPEALWLGLVLVVPYALGNRIGQALFDPGREGLYRRVAYAIIAASALVGLPIWR
jgi:uncharacterized protein